VKCEGCKAQMAFEKRVEFEDIVYDRYVCTRGGQACSATVRVIKSRPTKRKVTK
jgi:hypothetical protein